MRAVSMAVLGMILLGCDGQPWNSPYPSKESSANIYYGAFAERPKYLDPAKAYSVNEAVFISQIYEPPLQYNYFERPYTLEPLTAVQMPVVQYFDVDGELLPANASPHDIAMSVYEISIKPGILYQPHPAFALLPDGQYRYHDLTEKQVRRYPSLNAFKETGTRELTAEDYVYQIKRLARPDLNSPVFGLMSKRIIGLQEYSQVLLEIENDAWIDLRQYPLSGVTVLDRYRYQIKINGDYPQFRYWLAMSFFAPMPWEAEYFHSQPGMKQQNLVLDWYPVGTGPYQLTVNNPNRKMVLAQNPHYREDDFYPDDGSTDNPKIGQPMPFIEQAIYSLERETIPRWNKFLQGYYDSSTLTSDSYGEAVSMSPQGSIDLTPAMQEKGITLQTAVALANYSLGFNMLDEVVGGDSERAQLLRRAISIVVDYEEFIAIFANGRGVAAQGPVPPGIFGFKYNDFNPYVYVETSYDIERKSVAEARQLLAQAGYPNGRSRLTGKPLVLHYDTVASGGPDEKAQLAWMRKQFEKLDIQLQIRTTQYNRFQEKMRDGNVQLFSWGWYADYPDPENFLFLFYSPNSRALHDGMNAANYHNPAYDALFEEMFDMPDSLERQEIIDKMVEILRRDAPLAWGYHPKDFALSHVWMSHEPLNQIANNNLKYLSIDPVLRAQYRQTWNQPVIWPLLLLLGLLVLFACLIVQHYRRKVHRLNPHLEKHGC